MEGEKYIDLQVQQKKWGGKRGWWGLQREVLDGLYDSAKEMKNIDAALLFLVVEFRRLCLILTPKDHRFSFLNAIYTYLLYFLSFIFLVF